MSYWRNQVELALERILTPDEQALGERLDKAGQTPEQIIQFLDEPTEAEEPRLVQYESLRGGQVQRIQPPPEI